MLRFCTIPKIDIQELGKAVDDFILEIQTKGNLIVNFEVIDITPQSQPTDTFSALVTYDDGVDLGEDPKPKKNSKRGKSILFPKKI